MPLHVTACQEFHHNELDQMNTMRVPYIVKVGAKNVAAWLKLIKVGLFQLWMPVISINSHSWQRHREHLFVCSLASTPLVQRVPFKYSYEQTHIHIYVTTRLVISFGSRLTELTPLCSARGVATTLPCDRVDGVDAIYPQVFFTVMNFNL